MNSRAVASVMLQYSGGGDSGCLDTITLTLEDGTTHSDLDPLIEEVKIVSEGGPIEMMDQDFNSSNNSSQTTIYEPSPILSEMTIRDYMYEVYSSTLNLLGLSGYGDNDGGAGFINISSTGYVEINHDDYGTDDTPVGDIALTPRRLIFINGDEAGVTINQDVDDYQRDRSKLVALVNKIRKVFVDAKAVELDISVNCYGENEAEYSYKFTTETGSNVTWDGLIGEAEFSKLSSDLEEFERLLTKNIFDPLWDYDDVDYISGNINLSASTEPESYSMDSDKSVKINKVLMLVSPSVYIRTTHNSYYEMQVSNKRAIANAAASQVPLIPKLEMDKPSRKPAR